MAGAEFVTAGTIRGRMYRIDWYPGLVLDDSGDEIQGEVYAVDAELLGCLPGRSRAVNTDVRALRWWRGIAGF
jgi:gamma-glutamylcyclotransferase (GGCT)/AIG2-like uncharacterized protein YtfP